MKSASRYLFLLFIFLDAALLVNGQIRIVDSLKHQLQVQKQDTNRAMTLIRLSEQMMQKDDTRPVFLYADSAISLSRKLNFGRGEGSGLENRGYYYLNLSRFDEAKKDFDSSLQVRIRIGDKRGVAQSYLSQANYYYFLGSFPDAAANMLHSLNLFEEINNKSGVAKCLEMLGSIYLNQGNDSDALKYTQKAVLVHNEIGENFGSAIDLRGIGLIEYDRHQYEKALQYFDESMVDLKKFAQSQSQIGYSYLYLGNTYQKLGDIAFAAADKSSASTHYLIALSKYDSAIDIFERINDENSKIIAGGHKARILIDQHNYKMAQDLLIKYMKYAKDNNDMPERAEAYASQAALDSAKGDYKNAFENYKLYVLYKDSMSEIKNNRNFVHVVMQHEYDSKTAAAKQLQAQKDATAQRDRAKQNLTIVSLAILILAVLIIAWIQWRNNKQKQEANRLLTEKNLQVEEVLSGLKSTQAQLIQSEKMASLGELTAGIAHEIQNPLNFVNNFSELNMELVDEVQKSLADGSAGDVSAFFADIKQNSEKIGQHGKRAEAIVRGMLEHSRKSTTQKEPADIKKLADEFLRLSYHGMRARDKSFHALIETDFDERVGQINMVSQDLGRALLNLFNNAFYALSQKRFPDSVQPSVKVSIQKKPGEVEIRVRDNGIGISKKIVDKVFQPFFTTKPAGQGTGLGLSISYDIIKAHGGEMTVKSEEGVFTEFCIMLSVN